MGHNMYKDTCGIWVTLDCSLLFACFISCVLLLVLIELKKVCTALGI
jgi:hypothetical protein